MKILILGGYGVFGGRLATLLSDLHNVEILICGRNLDRAKAFCRGMSGEAKFTPIALDRKDIAASLTLHKPDVVVDASGPFQKYQNNPYHIVKSCIETETHYLDFADCADFVFGISQFNIAAQKAGVFVLSGVSSFPVLTAAVLREFQKDMEIISVSGGIAPSPYAGIGLNVMRAVIGYAGGPVKLTRGGEKIVTKGLTESRRYTIAPPSFLPLHNIRFSLVDVPDLQVIPTEIPSLQSIWMGAGPGPEILHRTLNILAKARAFFHLPSFEPLSPVFYYVLNLMKFGEHRGGMFIEVTGYEKDNEKTSQKNQLVTKSWHLLAEGDDGPFIPSMAIEAIIRKYLRGNLPQTGAQPATRALDLADYDKLFENRALYTGICLPPKKTDSLYQKILGTGFIKLPKQLQRLHANTKNTTWAGEANVQSGKNIFAKGFAKILGFPKQANAVPLKVIFTPNAHGEHWERNFGDKKFSSIQKVGMGRNAHLLTEHFGPICIALALVLKNERLYLIPRRWSFLGVPMPKFLLPQGESYECVSKGIFHFDVVIKVPLIGLITAYQGWLKPIA